MTNSNENELKVGDVISHLSGMEVRPFDQIYLEDAIDKLTSLQEQLESARKEVESLKGLVEFGNQNRLDIIEAYESYPFVPEGWQLVPIEMTQPMLDQAILDMNEMGAFIPVMFYDSLLKAAPKPEDKQS